MKKLTLAFISLLSFALSVHSQNPPIVVTIGPRPDIVAAEYFFDTDPGYGSGTAVSVTADSIISESFNAEISALDVGYHLLYSRTLDENGKWSQTQIADFYKVASPPSPVIISPRPDIVGIEYFFDTDPGPGNGTAVIFSPNSLVDVNFMMDFRSLDLGEHLVYIRALDETGSWSLTSIEAVTKRLKRLLRHGQFFDYNGKQPIKKPQ